MFDRVQENYTSFRTNLHRAFVRPDPYGLPGWIINSDQLSEALVDTFGSYFKELIDLASENQAEVGTFICYDPYKDVLTHGPECWGHKQMVVIKDCIGYRSIGSYHVHLGHLRAVSFSPPDIYGGLHEFALAVGGNLPLYEMAVLSPYNYWRLNNQDKDKVDYSLRKAEYLMLMENALYEQQPQDWRRKLIEADRLANEEMNAVYRLLGLSYVKL